ncbi:transporter suffix domain-containing protein [Lysinibacillus sp. KU-BSD001]|uniref:transporter suffix domain-containing protein n=1 Tax=Lysinibacillus sp. KU-BSD001 TaxID=3141328 RepID=UPI0036E6F6AE
MKNKVLYKVGWVFIIIACLLWISLVVIPFLPFSLGMKAAAVTGAVVLAEVFFWIGAIFVGKEVITKYKKYLNPKNWRKNE